MRSLEILLSGLIDYAGLFPPAELDMPQAVARYADYRNGPESWMLGRFLTPVSRLDEFERAAQLHLSRETEPLPWKISVLAGAELESDLATIADFNQRQLAIVDRGSALIDTIEFRCSTVDEISRAMERVPKSLTVYVEIPISSDPRELIAAIAYSGVRAKARSGGISAEAFPSAAELVRFIERCVEMKTPFKATAGLHHPIRSARRLTYEPDSPFGLMHGFLNVFLAATWIENGMPAGLAIELMEETDAGEFHFDETGITWRGLKLYNDQLELSRRSLGMAFGSCSFVEPLEDLRSIGLR